ncbi:MAG: hypothetical protein Q4P13_05810 [Psychrobacter sp.]|nr:hypothetical protein [Psychrobacter sp.]
MGQFDYEALRDNEVQPGSAYLIQKVLASISPTPHWDLMYFVNNSYAGRANFRSTNQKLEIAKIIDQVGMNEQKRLARKAYVTGINSLKARISDKKDPMSLVNELKAIAEEMAGFSIGVAETEEIKRKKDEAIRLYKDMQAKDKEYWAVAAANHDGQFVTSPSKVAQYLNSIKYNNKSYNSNFSFAYAMDDYVAYAEAAEEATVMESKLYCKGMLEDQALAWISLGERFWNIIELTSGTFVKHANNAVKGKYSDWDLVIPPDKDTGKKGAKKKSTFELLVADEIKREGGKEVNINSTIELKEEFGFRDIQSGTWVLKDKSSAEFHVKSAAAAMMDLSDIVGIDPKNLAFGGRLALAIGARGRAGALAHYEPSQRVINLTKMKGGGSLGHEWFHSIDNILTEVLGAKLTGKDKPYITLNPNSISHTPLSSAFAELKSAMLEGDSYSYEKFNINDDDVELAKLNITPDKKTKAAGVIVAAGNAQDAVRAIDDYFQVPSERVRRNSQQYKWRRLAVAYYLGTNKDQPIYLKTGERVSEFLANSQKIDLQRSSPYWSTTHEMAARAFQAYLEDRLKDQGRRNDYLSYGADNALYEGHKAYPEGKEREAINKVFDNLFKVLKDEKILENATNDQAMMDSIFGAAQ